MRSAIIIFFYIFIIINCANRNMLDTNNDEYNLLEMLIEENDHFKNLALYVEPLCFSQEANWDMLSEIDKLTEEDVNKIKASIVKKCDYWIAKSVPFKITQKGSVGAIYLSRPVYLEDGNKSFLLINYLSRSYYCIFEKNGNEWKLVEKTLYLVT